MPEVAGGHQPMKRRGFIAAALALVPGMALLRPKPAPDAPVYHIVTECPHCGYNLDPEPGENWESIHRRTGVPCGEWMDEIVLCKNNEDPFFHAHDRPEVYGRGPAWKSLEDQRELKRVYMASNSCGKTGSVESEILNRGFEDAIIGANEATSRDFDNMLERFRRKQGLS